ncbi:MAG: FAD-binding oxidoreductase [Actinomycetota bacterium]|nr:FAD-binding oxidoreductase [Actinomycetota bacterium]
MTEPTAPIELTGTGTRLAPAPALPAGFAEQLAAVCATVTDVAAVAEASRDWWPLAMHWSLAGQVLQRAAVVARPAGTDEVAAVLALCNAAGVPVTAAGGRSGVVGASIPLFGGVLLDTTAMQGIVSVDAVSGIVEVLPGTFGPELEAELRSTHGLTVGHFPQSFDIATVGGWVACRGAGQYSTRYGKIEQMVVGLEVVLADGSVVRTGGFPAGAQGPDLTQLFVGSEGTLGVVTRVWLKAHPVPPAEQRAAYSFATFEAGLDACRRIMRRGATPAVLRLYDAVESQRGQGADGSYCVLLVLDEGDALLVDATMRIVAQECADPYQGQAAAPLPVELVERWMHHRNDTSALQGLTRKGFVVDTLEIAAPWSALPTIFQQVCAAMLAVPHARAASCHLSHSYLDGACLYFTFAATPPPEPEQVEDPYVALWDAGQQAVLAHGGNLSHHPGVGLNRARFMPQALGSAMPVLQAMKTALDPNGVLNPGKMGLATRFGAAPWGGQ